LNPEETMAIPLPPPERKSKIDNTMAKDDEGLLIEGY